MRKVGEKIMVRHGSGILSLATITRVTPTGRFEAGGWEWNQDDSARGWRWHHGPRPVIIDQTPEVIAEWEAQQRRKWLSQALDRLDIYGLSDASVVALIAAVKTATERGVP
jgi:hypothetical protein